MSLKSFFDRLREEEKKRRQEEKASLNTDVNVFKNKPVSTPKASAKSGANAGGKAKTQSNTAKVTVKATSGAGTSAKTHNTDMIDMDWGLNAKAYADMTVKPKKTSVNKSADMIDNDYGFNVKAMDDYLRKMRSGSKAEANKGAVIYDNVSNKIKDNKYASTMINIGKEFSNFGKYNHLNDLYYINNPSGLDDGYKYINKDDMNKYFYLLAQHKKGDIDKKDVDDLKHYLFRIGEPIDKKEADELPPIENKPDYSKISSDEQLIYDSYGNAVNKAKNIDYSDIPTDDQLPKEPGKIKVDKSKNAVDKDYGLDLSSYKDMNKIKSDDTDKPERDIDYSKISSDEQILNDLYTKAVDKAEDIDYNKVYDSFGFEVSNGYNKSDKTGQKEGENAGTEDYIEKSLNQIIKGNYTDDVTALGTAGQIGLGLTGLDFAADIRDLTYDFSHWEWSGKHILQTVLDAVGLIPGIGVIKNLDEVAYLVKTAIQSSDVIVPVVKKALDNVDTVIPALKQTLNNMAVDFPQLVSLSKQTVRNLMKRGDEAGKGLTDANKNAANFINEIKYKPSSGAVLKTNSNKTTTILGDFHKDMKKIIKKTGNIKSTDFGAKKGGFNILNVPDDMYKNADQFWDEINLKWLDEAIDRGDDFILATKPTSDVLWKIDPITRTKTLKGFGREYERMIEKGYFYDPLTNMMIRK